jgi:DNA-binding response OmpR family regulator
MSFHSAPIRLLCWPIQRINWIFSSPTALPSAEGLALAKRLRADQRDLPVLFMTGDDGHEDLASEHVLMKPFTGADLLRAFGRRIQSARHSETPLADCFAA